MYKLAQMEDKRKNESCYQTSLLFVNAIVLPPSLDPTTVQ